ncbi:MAG: peptide deformylase [bacterium]
MKQSIIKVPNDILRKVCVPVTTITRELEEQVVDLEEALKQARNPEGVGLSFPQLGILTRGFVTYIDHRMNIYLNPEIIDMGDEKTLGPREDHPLLEGCLSIPHLYGPVWRSRKIRIKAIDEKGREHTANLSNFAARVFLHEYDHLDGILFTDYTKSGSLPLYFHDLEKDEFIEIEDPSAVIKW